MSLTHEQIPAATTEKPAGLRLRSFLFPLIVLLLFGGFFAMPWILVAFDVDTSDMIPLSMMSQWLAPPAGIFLLGVWWLFFSPFRWLVRLALVALLVMAATGYTLCVRQFEITKGRVSLVPRVYYIWDPEYAEQGATNPDELPPTFGYVGPDDFPRYRGANSDGLVGWARLETDWDKTPPTVLWRQACAGGYSGIAVAGNIVVTLEQRAEGESVVCYDRNTGKQRWASASRDVFYRDKSWMGDGPRSTPTIHDYRIYTIGATGELACHDFDGKRIWRTNILEDGKAKNVKWGMTGSPLIIDDLVIANPGIDEDAPAHSALIAYGKTDGKIRWQSGNRPAGYSSPQLVTLGGVPQILLFDGAALAGYQPKTGTELWNFPWITDFSMNSIQPVVFGLDRVFISSEQKNGCAMLRVKPPEKDRQVWKVDVVWQNKNLAARYANPVTDGKSIFGLHALQGVLTCLDADTGKVKWKGDREGPGQLLLAANALIVVNGDTGDVALFDPAAESSCVELARFAAFEKRDKTWNTPALAGDQLFVRNQAEIVCLQLPRH